MEGKVTWKGRMSFEGTAESGFTIPVGGRKEADGEGNGFSPMELLLVGLAGCTAMDVISILEKKRQDVTDFALARRVSGLPSTREFTPASISSTPSPAGEWILPQSSAQSSFRRRNIAQLRQCSVRLPKSPIRSRSERRKRWFDLLPGGWVGGL